MDAQYDALIDAGSELLGKVSELPASRERSLAITNIEQGLLWVGAAIVSPNGAPAT